MLDASCLPVAQHGENSFKADSLKDAGATRDTHKRSSMFEDQTIMNSNKIFPDMSSSLGPQGKQGHGQQEAPHRENCFRICFGS